jgi:hypothetical protein
MGFGGTVTQGFTLGYFRVLPNGRMNGPESRWLGFVVGVGTAKGE